MLFSKQSQNLFFLTVDATCKSAWYFFLIFIMSLWILQICTSPIHTRWIEGKKPKTVVSKVPLDNLDQLSESNQDL